MSTNSLRTIVDVRNAGIWLILLFVNAFSAVSFGDSEYCSQASTVWHQWRKHQQRFPIATWAYFSHYSGNPDEYQSYAGANMTYVAAPLTQYDNAVNAGLQVLIGGWENLGKKPEKLAKYVEFANKHPNTVIGYQLADEPQPNQFEEFKNAISSIYDLSKTTALPIIDMLPNWAWQRNAHRVTRFGMSYAEMMEKYVEQVQPPVLLNCHYPTMEDGSDKVEFYANYEHFRELALARNVGLMGFVLVNHYVDYRQPSESDIRWQVNTALAYGAQGIWYWNWRIKPIKPFGEGLVSHETGKPLPAYYQVKKINAEVLALGNILLKLKSRLVFHTGTKVPEGTRRFTHTGNSGWSSIEMFEGEDFIISEFKNQNDQNDMDSYVLLVNKRHGKEINSADEKLLADAVFRPTQQYNFIYKYDSANGQLKKMKPDLNKSESGIYRCRLEGGQAILFRFARKPLLGEQVIVENRKKLTAGYIKNLSDIDGNVNKPVWNVSQWNPLQLSLLHGPGGEPKEAGRVKVAWDDKNLYIAADLVDSDILALGKHDGEDHYRLGDVFEVFIKPELADWYWEIWLSPKNHKTSLFWEKAGQKGADKGHNYSLEFDTAVTVNGKINDPSKKDIGWTCEMRIPFEQIEQKGLLDTKGRWLLLLARQNHTGKVLKETRELSTYPQLSQDSFHLTAEYAVIEMRINSPKF